MFGIIILEVEEGIDWRVVVVRFKVEKLIKDCCSYLNKINREFCFVEYSDVEGRLMRGIRGV